MIAQKIEILWLNLVRFYTYYFPIDKGKWRVFAFAKRLCRHLPEKIVATTRDGRKLSVTLSDWVGDSVFFLGKHEDFSTKIFERQIKKGFICLDVGANIGWHTTLMSRLSGKQGEVHAFEPVPPTFADLEKNVLLNSDGAKVYLNNFGLGDKESTAEIHLFKDLPSGHATLAGKDNQPSDVFSIKIKTLDSYLEEKNIDRVDFIKVDIEGAEMMFLEGSQKIFKQKRAPVIYMEMTLETSREFGYMPNDLIVFLKNKASYKFFRVAEAEKKLVQIEGFTADDIGANVLCLPQDS